MAQNRSISNGVARAAYACSLAVHCGLVLGLLYMLYYLLYMLYYLLYMLYILSYIILCYMLYYIIYCTLEMECSVAIHPNLLHPNPTLA